MIRHEDKLRWTDGKPQIREGDHWRQAEQRECLWCGERFWTRDQPTKPDKGKFCSRACVNKNNAKQNRLRRIHKKCPICHRQFATSPSTRHTSCQDPHCRKELRRRINLVMTERSQRVPHWKTRLRDDKGRLQ